MEHYLDPHMEQADHAYNLQGPQDIPAEDLDGMPPWPEDAELEWQHTGLNVTAIEFCTSEWLRRIL